jgi:hypothetical protein
MERKTEASEPRRDGKLAEGGNRHAVRFLPASEQFYTRSCARCAGLLVNDWCYDLDNPGEYTVEVLRCVQCGHRVDSVIVWNQSRSRVANGSVRPAERKGSESTELSSQAA